MEGQAKFKMMPMAKHVLGKVHNDCHRSRCQGNWNLSRARFLVAAILGQ